MSHPKLLHKLSSYGIHGNLFLRISAFLSNRFQKVKVGSSLSKFCQVNSSVSQGSVIRSLLFNLYINDITDNLSSTSTSNIFADDIKIYTELLNQNSNTNFQTQRDNIYLWSVSWQLKISHTKCHLLCLGRQRGNGMQFSINGAPLAVENFATNLGVSYYWYWFKI